MYKFKHLLTNIFIIFCALAVAALLFLTKEVQHPQFKEQEKVVVNGLIVKPQALQNHVELVGRLRPSRQAELQFEVSGQLIHRYVEPGQTVNTGHALLGLDSTRYQQMLIKAEAASRLDVLDSAEQKHLLSLSQESVALQEKEVARLIKLHATGLVSSSMLEQAKRAAIQKKTEATRLRYAVEKAPSRHKNTLANLKNAQYDVDKTQLRAPFDGVVNNVFVEVGDYVTQGQAVVTLINTDILELPLEANTMTTTHLKIAQKVAVVVADKSYIGTIIAIEKNPSPVSLTHTIILHVSGDGLLPGLHAKATLLLARYDGAVAIPETALLFEENGAFVFKITGGVLSKAPVQIGERIASMRIINVGLVAGENIVANNVAAMNHGLSVRLQSRFNK